MSEWLEGPEPHTGVPRLLDPHTGNYPADFWQAPELKRLAQWADYTSTDRIGLLATVLTAATSSIQHLVRVPPGPVGYHVPPTLFVCMVGPSGNGKTLCLRKAWQIQHPTHEALPKQLYGVKPASGEAIVEALMGTVLDPEDEKQQRKMRAQVAHNMLMHIDELESLLITSGRQGNISRSTMREARSGGPLSTMTVNGDTTRYIAPGSYTISAIAGAQPHLAARLIEDDGTGFAERWLTLWVTRRYLPRRDRPKDKPLLPFRLHSWWPRVLAEDQRPERAPLQLGTGIWSDLEAYELGQSDNHPDAEIPHHWRLLNHGKHTGQLALRTAAAFARLHQPDYTTEPPTPPRPRITAQDWWRAKVLLYYSAQTRAHLRTVAAQQEIEEDHRYGQRQAQRDQGRQATNLRAQTEIANHRARWETLLTANWQTQAALTGRGWPGRNRQSPHIQTALDQLIATGQVEAWEGHPRKDSTSLRLRPLQQ